MKKLDLLEGAQERASDPRRLVWLSASAGTGKTHVLTARVLRLLLAGVAPETILCLTFTKAGAAEMAERIHARLAYWVRLPERELKKELFALGEDPHDPAALAFARTLFATVLDAAGGLRILTIHAFCQTLLAGFPAEAGLTPGFRPLEGREEAQLARATLAELLVAAERGGDLPLIRDVQTLSRRLGEGPAEAFLLACGRAPDAMAALGSGIEAKLRRAMEVPDGDIEASLADACADQAFDCGSLGAVAAANAAWGTPTGLGHADAIARWRALSPAERAAGLAGLHEIWAKKDGELRAVSKGQEKADPDYSGHVGRLHGACTALLALRAKAAFAAVLAAGLRAGQAYARAYAEAKRATGTVDFDDLIRATVALLRTPGMGDWVRYKLDQATDHILVDEAQDTNADQWEIVAKLAGEFFAGEGARGDGRLPLRTIFTVGDFKQAIFGFQGTDPMAFEAARRAFGAHAEQAERQFEQLSLDRSFRSTPPVLEVVDRLLDNLGAEALGLIEASPTHHSARRDQPGSVTLWRPFQSRTGEDEEGEEGWFDDAVRAYATRLARQIREWLDAPLPLRAAGRPLRPEDVLILVRRRSELAALLVARLHAEGVPVAGVDRLRLNAPLAVRDLLATIRFVLQPEDDLNLAALLVSPIVGLTQDELFRVAFGRRGSLFQALRANGGFPDAQAILDQLRETADLVTPYRFLERLLSGPIGARARLLGRLGHEAADPIEELLSAALDFETRGPASLQLFLDWFDRGEVEIKRDPSAPLDAVRVMTVHGAKGLQAPLVILADATADPDDSLARSLRWEDAPIFRPRKEERHDPFAGLLATAESREREEHWRLLYVALTRAEERLIVAGALTPGMRGAPPASSWYSAVERALDDMGVGWTDDPLWGRARHHETGTARVAAPPRRRAATPAIAEPGWLRRPAPRESQPPRPLAPSAIGQDEVADPPPGPTMRAAAERGRLLHALFERLPPLPPADRPAAAARWLEGSAGVTDAALRDGLVKDACAILADPRFAAVFAADALAEAPIAAVVGGRVIAGTVDRLLVTPDRVLIVDFKTGRRVPADADTVPDYHLDQMAAYAAALAAIFPDRAIEAALLYTAGPRLITLPAALLAARKPGLQDQDQSLGLPR
nr:double-strand break repair helicase AddA [Sphingomonas quercus]